MIKESAAYQWLLETMKEKISSCKVKVQEESTEDRSSEFGFHIVKDPLSTSKRVKFQNVIESMENLNSSHVIVEFYFAFF